MKIEHSIFTDRGSRAVNEDRAGFAVSGDRFCFIVCDGLGGHGMGDIAAQTVVDAVRQSFLSSSGLDAFASDALEQAQAALLAAQTADPRMKHMKTTAVLLCMEGNRGISLHIGDSRLYRFRNGKLLGRTADHSLPQVLYMTGEISEAEIRFHPDRNRMLHALGEETEALRIVKSEFAISAGDAFLLCSDGFWEPVTEPDMEDALQSAKGAKAWLSALSALAVQRIRTGKADNLTAVAVTVKE